MSPSGAQRHAAQRLQRLHVGAVGAAAVGAGHLQQEGQVAEGGMGEDVEEALVADVALADVLVAVHAAGQGALGVVGVDGHQPLQPYLAVELLHGRLQPLAGAHVVAGGEHVLGVQADTDTLVPGRPHDAPQLGEARAHGVAHAGRVLQHQPGVGGRPLQHLQQRLDEAGEDLLQPYLLVAAQVEDDPLHAQAVAQLHVRHQRLHRLGHQGRVGAGQVDQVGAMDVVGPDALGLGAGAKGLHLLGTELASAPALGGGSKDLHRFGAHLQGAVNGLVHSAGGGDVGADPHVAPPLRPSGWRPRARRRPSSQRRSRGKMTVRPTALSMASAEGGASAFTLAVPVARSTVASLTPGRERRPRRARAAHRSQASPSMRRRTVSPSQPRTLVRGR